DPFLLELERDGDGHESHRDRGEEGENAPPHPRARRPEVPREEGEGQLEGGEAERQEADRTRAEGDLEEALGREEPCRSGERSRVPGDRLVAETRGRDEGPGGEEDHRRRL